MSVCALRTRETHLHSCSHPTLTGNELYLTLYRHPLPTPLPPGLYDVLLLGRGQDAAAELVFGHSGGLETRVNPANLASAGAAVNQTTVYITVHFKVRKGWRS